MKSFFYEIKKNWKSGLVVAVVSIPLSISLAIASGWSPIQWLISAIWAMGIAAIFGSSKHNIFGPAWALSGILIWFSLTHWPQYLPIIAIVSGIFLLIAFFSKSIKYITLIPAPWLQWFLFAVWLTILISQLPTWLWIDIPTHEKIYSNVIEIIRNLSGINRMSLITCVGWIWFLIISKRKIPQIPGAILLSIIGIWLWFMITKWLIPNMTLLIDKYPNLSFWLWDFSYVKGSIDMLGNNKIISDIIKISVIIAVITILETIISGKIWSKMSKKNFNKDKEILANSLANIWSGLMWWMPNTAVLVRTALNIKSGATSKYSQWIASIFTLVISLLLFNKVFVLIPMSIISAILIYIAIGIMDFSVLKKFYNFKKTSFYIILITIIFSVLFDTVIGILVWTILTLLIFIARVTNTDPRVTIFRDKNFYTKTNLKKYINKQLENDIIIIKFAWELNYLNIDNQFSDIKKIISWSHIIFSFEQLSDIDIDGLESLEDAIERLINKWVKIYITWRNIGIKNICLRTKTFNQLSQNWYIYESKTELLKKFWI